MSEYDQSAFEMIVELRGGLPETCDFCRQPFTKQRYPARWDANAKIAGS